MGFTAGPWVGRAIMGTGTKSMSLTTMITMLSIENMLLLFLVYLSFNYHREVTQLFAIKAIKD